MPDGKDIKDLSKREFEDIALFIYDEYRRRKDGREDREKIWKDIDRQVEMQPDISHKKTPDGRADPNLAWLPEVELPLQAQTLEVLVADAMRMQRPSSKGGWFAAHAALTDKYLERVDFSAIIAGDENEVPTLINQDNADKLVQATLLHWQSQYDFWGNVSRINTEAFKYGTGVGRGRMARKASFQHTARGIINLKQRFPILYPVSIKNTYLDDRRFALMGEGHVMGPATIFWKNQKLKDLQEAAKDGEVDPEKDNGGWMKAQLADLKPDKHGDVQVLEWEGDLVVPRSTESLFYPHVRVYVAIGKNEPRVFKVQFIQEPYTSTVEFPYHAEDQECAYATSPLMKGWSIQKAAVNALSRALEAAALNTQPPLSYDGDDLALAQAGGPLIEPRAQWPTLGGITTHEIGDPSGSFAMYQALVNQYYDVTGVNAPRLGAQTNSHTTAFAKEAEMNRGQVRTVDYASDTLGGPLTNWLHMAYDMGRSNMRKTMLYVPSYNGYVEIDAKALPDLVTFESFGAGGPAEEQVKQQRKMQAMQLALSLEQLRAQAQQIQAPTHIDFEKAIDEVLMDGGWTDLDAITRTEEVATGPAEQPGVEGAAGGAAFAPATAISAFQGP